MLRSMEKLNVGDLRLCGGSLLTDVEVSYLALGRLNEAGNNAVLVTHGFTSGPSMLAPTPVGVGEGSWAGLVGPQAAIDTNRFFVICPNMLGSCYGTTGPASVNPATGSPWGPDFPEYSVSDMVASQHALLARLGIKRLRAVVGPSYGGIQALQWAIEFPQMVEAIGVAVSGPRFPSQLTPESILRKLEAAPNWNGGWIYENGGIVSTLERLRMDTLREYGTAEVLKDQGVPPKACEDAIRRMARAWAQEFDPNSLVALCKAGQRFDVTAAIETIAARMLWVASSTDTLFPPDPEVEARVRRNSVSANTRYVTLQSRYGHVASGADYRKWEPMLRELLQ